VACPNVRTLKTKLSTSGFGKFFGELSEKIEYSTFNERLSNAFKELVGPTGLSPDELLDALTGKLGYVVMPFTDKVGQCVIVEAKEELPAMELLLHHQGNNLLARGFRSNRANENGIELVVWSSTDNDGSDVCGMCYFIVDGFAVIADHVDLLREVAKRWSGRLSVDRLSDDPEFQKEKQKSNGVADVELFARPKLLNKKNLTMLYLFDSVGLMPLIMNRCSALYADLRLGVGQRDITVTVGFHVDDSRNFLKRQEGDAISLMGRSNEYATTDAVNVSYIDSDFWTFEELKKRESVPKEIRDKVKNEVTKIMKEMIDKDPKLKDSTELSELLEKREDDGITKLFSENLQPHVVISQFPNHEYVTAYRLKQAEAKRDLMPGLLRSYKTMSGTFTEKKLGNDVIYVHTLQRPKDPRTQIPLPASSPSSKFYDKTYAVGVNGDHLLFASSQKFWEGSISTNSITELPTFSLVKKELSKIAGLRNAIAAQYFDFAKMLDGVKKSELYQSFLRVGDIFGVQSPDALLMLLSTRLGVGGSIVTLEENVFRYEFFMFARD